MKNNRNHKAARKNDPKNNRNFKPAFSKKHPKKQDVANLSGKNKPAYNPKEPIRLNRYLAKAGVCSRRDADKLISAGEVKVNGKVITELGVKVTPGKDEIAYKGKKLSIETLTYILLNKPKDYICTLKDEKGRKTVIELIRHLSSERVYPVGRLDRNTTGLLLFTNDGALSQKLTHPSFGIPKLYHVRLDKEAPKEVLQQILDGVTLEDGLIKADRIAYMENKPRNEVAIELHSGKNHIVKRIFAHFKLQVKQLDRVTIGPLTKKNLTRGNSRLLTQKEVGFLRMYKQKEGK